MDNNLIANNFINNIDDLSFDQVMDLYHSTEDFNKKALILQHRARKLQEFISRKDTLTSIIDIKEFVALLPQMQQEQRQIDLLANELKARMVANPEH